MYAAHAEQKRKETSKTQFSHCLNLIQSAGTDNENFAAILEITQNVRSSIYTDEDRQKILEAVGLDFVSRLIDSRCVPDGCLNCLYKSIALSLLSAWTVEPYVVNQPDMKNFLTLVNDVLDLKSPYKTDASTDTKALYEQMCQDCEEIVANLSQLASGITCLTECGTAVLLADFALSPQCQNLIQTFKSLGNIVKSRGDIILQGDVSKFNAVMEFIVNRLGQGSDLREKIDCAKILTSMLCGIGLVEISVECQWVRKLAHLIKTLIQFKVAPDEGEVILDLVCALVNAVGAETMSTDMTGDTTLLKTIVARASVEVYMLLDCIDLENAMERYPKLDRVYKLLSAIVEYLAGYGEALDSDSIIVVYKKLVEVSDTIVEFLISVAHQQVELPRNHCVVLITVRMLAAMLSEITEDPTPKLLELLPFFNLLCQNVEYSDDVILEVKNATQAALENIKLMGMSSIQEDEEPPVTAASTSSSPTYKHPSADSTIADQGKNSATDSTDINIETVKQSSSSALSPQTKTESAFADLNISGKASEQHFSQPHNTTDTHQHSGWDENQRGKDRVSSPTLSLSTISTSDFYIDLREGEAWDNSENNPGSAEGSSSSSTPRASVSLNQNSISNFKAFQTSVSAARSKPRPFSARKVTFSSRHKKKSGSSNSGGNAGCSAPTAELSQQWKPMPVDVLGFLLPTYAFLLESDEALEVMVRSDTFQTIVNFLETSLSDFLENKSSSTPENMTINALSVIEKVYTNSPTAAARVKCFQQLFEISVLSVPNLLTLPSPPHLVCLKFLEVSLAAYRLQMRGNKRNSSLPRMKHSQSRFFKAAIEYLSSVYEIREKPGRSKSLRLVRDIDEIWPLAEELWSGCVAGLCTLVRSADDLQEVLVKSPVIPKFMKFLREVDPEVVDSKEVIRTIVESILSLIESSAESSDILCELIKHSDGKLIASKFRLQKLARCLRNLHKSS